MNLFIPLLIFLLACVIFGYAYLLKRRTSRQKHDHGIPAGNLVYSDLTKPAEPLFSSQRQLAGKPDYILRQDGNLVPVEVKSGHHTHPQPSHILQLAAYCQLLEDTSGEFVPFGILVLDNQPTKISYDPNLRFSLDETMNRMRRMLRSGKVTLNHDDPHRCLRCSMQQYCSMSLGEKQGT